jgi:hypothetical protein
MVVVTGQQQMVGRVDLEGLVAEEVLQTVPVAPHHQAKAIPGVLLVAGT